VPARAHAELYYCPARQPGAKFAIVLSGNALYYSGELRGGVSTAWELHEQGYAVFRCQSDIQMLARPRANPSVRTQHHPHDAWSQCLQRIDACGLPAQPVLTNSLIHSALP
jgi:hypothetical protein